ncbi:MAG: glycosyltransferase family 2 protein [Phycisphaeraceae bacterium]
MTMMMPYILLALLWTAWGTQAVLSAVQVRKFARRLERAPREKFDAYRPPAAVIVPFKGVEPALADNLRALCTQEYPAYRLVLVVQTEDDPAHAALKQAVRDHPDRRIDLVVAGHAPATVGQKVHNQLAALDHLHSATGDEQVWVFADSDAVPGPNWLGNLVGPLEREDRGLTTGYRWLVPEGTDGRPATIWAKLASVMNGSVACFAGRDQFNQAWGGSMAVRVGTARQAELVDSLEGCLTDDYPLTRMTHRLGKRVYFVPRCLVASPVSFSFTELVNFAHRQYLITRVYAPGLYAAAALLPALYLAGFGSAWAALLTGLLTAPRGPLWIMAATAIAVVFVANQIRASYRKRAVRNAFGQAMVERLHATLLLDRWATPLWMALHWALILRAGFGRTMRWRGIRYELRGPQAVRRLN